MKTKKNLLKLFSCFLIISVIIISTFVTSTKGNENEAILENIESTEATSWKETESVKKEPNINEIENQVEIETEVKVEETSPTIAPTEPQKIEETKVVEKNYTNSASAQEARENPEFLAKLLFAEAGGMTWEGQVYTCSAILNLCDHRNTTIWKAGHQKNTFSVAPYVDSRVPTKTQYEVIDYVLNGGRIPEICYFRTNHYHGFGTPVVEVDGHYFSKP